MLLMHASKVVIVVGGNILLCALYIYFNCPLGNMMEAVTNEETLDSIVNILEQEESVELKQNCLTLLKVLLDQSGEYSSSTVKYIAVKFQSL